LTCFTWIAIRDPIAATNLIKGFLAISFVQNGFYLAQGSRPFQKIRHLFRLAKKQTRSKDMVLMVLENKKDIATILFEMEKFRIPCLIKWKFLKYSFKRVGRPYIIVFSSFCSFLHAYNASNAHKTRFFVKANIILSIQRIAYPHLLARNNGHKTQVQEKASKE
jgi:hypothetical protein